MTDQQLRFVEAYVRIRKGAPAARKAGYSVETARQEAYKLLQNEEVKREIASQLKAQTITAEAATKDLSDIAKTRLNDYMKVVQVLRTPTVRKPLQQLINELDAEMEFEEEFATIAKLSGNELLDHKTEQKRRELKGIRYALELERNPHAYRDVPGESVWVEDIEVDLVALAKSKQKGRIKSLKFNEHGPIVEMYAADTALKTLLELDGKFVKKHEHSGPNGGAIPLNNLTDEQLSAIIASASGQ